MLQFFGFLAGARFVDDGAFCLLETGGRSLVDARTRLLEVREFVAVMKTGESVIQLVKKKTVRGDFQSASPGKLKGVCFFGCDTGVLRVQVGVLFQTGVQCSAELMTLRGRWALRVRVLAVLVCLQNGAARPHRDIGVFAPRGRRIRFGHRRGRRFRSQRSRGGAHGFVGHGAARPESKTLRQGGARGPEKTRRRLCCRCRGPRHSGRRRASWTRGREPSRGALLPWHADNVIDEVILVYFARTLFFI